MVRIKLNIIYLQLHIDQVQNLWRLLHGQLYNPSCPHCPILSLFDRKSLPVYCVFHSKREKVLAPFYHLQIKFWWFIWTISNNSMYFMIIVYNNVNTKKHAWSTICAHRCCEIDSIQNFSSTWCTEMSVRWTLHGFSTVFIRYTSLHNQMIDNSFHL